MNIQNMNNATARLNIHQTNPKPKFGTLNPRNVLTLIDKFEKIKQANTSVKDVPIKKKFLTQALIDKFEKINQTNTSVKDVQAKSSNNDTKRLRSSFKITQDILEQTNKKTENQDAQVGGIQVQNTAQPTHAPSALSSVQQERETENQDAQVETNQIQNGFQPMNPTNTSVKDVQTKSSNNDTKRLRSSFNIAQDILEQTNKKTENQDAQEKLGETDSECEWQSDWES